MNNWYGAGAFVGGFRSRVSEGRHPTLVTANRSRLIACDSRESCHAITGELGANYASQYKVYILATWCNPSHTPGHSGEPFDIWIYYHHIIKWIYIATLPVFILILNMQIIPSRHADGETNHNGDIKPTVMECYQPVVCKMWLGSISRQ